VNGGLLVTGGDEIGVLGAVRGLRAAGHTTWVQARSPGSYAGRSRAAAGTIVAPDPRSDPAGFASSLAAAAERLGVAAVLPGTEAGLVALAPRAESFPAGVALGVPEVDVVERATSKEVLAELAGRVGLRMPPTTRLSVSAFENGASAPLELPAVVKPLRSDTPLPGGGLLHDAPRLVHSLSELGAALSTTATGEALIQPYLPGEIYGVCGVAWKGHTVCTMHQIGRRIWPPDCGMVSYAETLPRDLELDGRVRALVAAIGWSGIFQLQLLSHRGSLYAIDFNPRVYISISLAIASGLNLPAVWAALLLGAEPPVSEYATGIRWRSEPDDPRSILRSFRDGERRRSLLAALPRPRTTHAVFSWRDPAPLVTTLGRITAGRSRP
jgi:predicted ATP-grasp superfamily ATP-dependent carboligase